MTIGKLKEIIDKFPEDYKVKFYVDDKCFNIEANGDSPFNNTLFLFGNRQDTKEFTKEEMLEQLNKLVEKVTNADTNLYII